MGLRVGGWLGSIETGARVGGLEGLAVGLFVAWTGLALGNFVGLSVSGAGGALGGVGAFEGVAEGLSVIGFRVGGFEGLSVGLSTGLTR